MKIVKRECKIALPSSAGDHNIIAMEVCMLNVLNSISHSYTITVRRDEVALMMKCCWIPNDGFLGHHFKEIQRNCNEGNIEVESIDDCSSTGVLCHSLSYSIQEVLGAKIQ